LGYVVLVLAVAAFVLYLLNDTLGWLQWFQKIGPLWLPAALLVLAALALWQTEFRRLARYLGYAALALGAVGIAIAVGSSSRGWTMPGMLGPPGLLSALLFAAAFILLAPAYRLRTHYVAYAALVVALAVGALVHFRTGRFGGLRIGPIPKGTPVNLLANVNPDADPKALRHAVKVTLNTLAEIKSKRLCDEDAQRLMRERIAPELMKVNKCPDFVMDQGHYYEWFKQMNDGDKEALIELLKTF
jgi:hypothetical protein